MYPSNLQKYKKEVQYLAERQLLIPNNAFYPEHYFEMIEKTGLVYFIFEAQTHKLLYVSAGYSDIWGKDYRNLYKHSNSWIFHIHEEDYYRANHSIRTRWRSNYEFEEEFRIVRQDSSVCPIHVWAFPLFDRALCITHHLAIVEDRSSYYRLKNRYRADLDRFAYFFNKSSLPLAVNAATGHFKFVNDALCKLLGYDKYHLLHLSWNDLIENGEPSYDRLIEPLLAQKQNTVEANIICRTKDNRCLELSFNIGLSGCDDDFLFNIQITRCDADPKFTSENSITLSDRFSELPDRRLFLALLQRELYFTSNQRSSFCLLLISFPRLYDIARTEEKLYQQILNILISRFEAATLGWEYTLGSVGPDCFALILREANSKVDLLDARSFCRKLKSELESSVVIEGRELLLKTKIAVVFYNDTYKFSRRMFRDAELTLSYMQQHSEEYLEFDLTIRQNAKIKLELASVLPKAIRNREFTLHYQPIVNLETSRLYGFEALVRWQHGDDLVSPTRFIPLCEDMDLIVPLGMDLIHLACKTLRGWHLEYPNYRDLVVSVNLSAKQFQHPTLISEIEDILRDTGLDGSYLKLEVTETVFIDDYQKVISILKRLFELKIRISIDDFGTGYSSLSYLQNIPAQTLKLDRSFVSGIDRDKNKAIASTVVTLGRLMDMDIIAEGIETKEQLAILRLLQVEYGQGFYFDRALPVLQIEKLLQQNIVYNCG